MTTVDAPYGLASTHRIFLPRTPAAAAVRVHHTQWAESSFSYSRHLSMQLQVASSADTTRVFSSLPLHLSADTSSYRVLTLADTNARSTPDETTAPATPYWCLDADDHLVAVVMDLWIAGEGPQLCAVSPEQFAQHTLTGTVEVSADGQVVTGRVHVSLTAERVAIGVQIPVEGTPILTVSFSGEFRAGDGAVTRFATDAVDATNGIPLAGDAPRRERMSFFKGLRSAVQTRV